MYLKLILPCIAVMTLLSSTCRGQFEELLENVPDNSNAIVLLNLEKIHNSPFAKARGWDKQDPTSLAKHPFHFPLGTQKVVLCANLDLHTGEVVTNWETALVRMNQVRNIVEVVNATNGKETEVAGREAVRAETGTLVVHLGGNVWSGSFPGNVQRVSRWVQGLENGQKTSLPPYLNEAASYAMSDNSDTEIVMAMDLMYAIDRGRIEEILPNLESLKGASYSLSSLSKLLAGIKGVTLGIKLEDDPYGRVKVDFSGDASMLEPYGKELMLEILAATGAMIDDFNEWQFRVEGDQAYITGKISAGGIRRLGSLIEPPNIRSTKAEYSENDYEQSGLSEQAYATKQNFQAMQELVDDLLGKRRTASTSGQAALWYERYARKIDRLPVANVDKELLDLNVKVANMLRAAATSKKNANAQAGVARKYAQGGAYRGNYGYYYSQGDYSTAAQASAMATGAMDSEQILLDMENEISATRRRLAEKYNMNL